MPQCAPTEHYHLSALLSFLALYYFGVASVYIGSLRVDTPQLLLTSLSFVPTFHINIPIH